jgi:hypothetical protein
MKFALLATVVSALLACFAGQASAQDIERVRQIDRVCLGRMLIVQTMAVVKEHGKTEQEYREENPFDPRWKPAMKAEVSAVIAYVWSHSRDENVEFSGAVMQACYEQNTES